MHAAPFSFRRLVCRGGAIMGGSLVALATSSVAFAGLTAGCIPQDLNASGAVDGADLGLLLAEWGPGGGFGPADFDNSGAVDGGDLGLLLAAWGDVPPIACIEIHEIVPASAPPGTEVTLTGQFRGNPDDYCLVAMTESGGVIPFEVTAVSSTELKAIVGPSAPDVGTGAMMVGLGDGTTALPSGPPGAIYGGDTWSWAADGPGAMFDVEFTPAPSGAPISGSFYGTLVGGDLCVVISGDCPAGTAFQVWPRAHHYGNNTPNDPYVGYDCFIPCVQVPQDSTRMDCATLICQAIQAAYAAHVPPIAIDCTVSAVTGGTKLTLSLPGLNIDWGMFNIVVLGPNACAPPTGCDPDCPCDVNGDGIVDDLDLFAIEMAFGTICRPANPCCADLNGDNKVDQLDILLWFNDCPIGPCQPPGCDPCDINGDGVVDGADRDAIIAKFGTQCPAGTLCCEDLDGNGQVDGADLALWLGNCQ